MFREGKVGIFGAYVQHQLKKKVLQLNVQSLLLLCLV